MKMVKGRLAFGLALAAVVGCSTVREAREAQTTLAAKGNDAAAGVAAEKVDLRGWPLARLVEFELTNRLSVVSKTLAMRDARLALKALAADAPILSDTPWTAPKLSVSGGHSEASEAVQIDDGDLWRTRGGPSAALSLELLVYDFGRYAAKARAPSSQAILSMR